MQLKLLSDRLDEEMSQIKEEIQEAQVYFSINKEATKKMKKNNDND